MGWSFVCEGMDEAEMEDMILEGGALGWGDVKEEHDERVTNWPYMVGQCDGENDRYESQREEDILERYGLEVDVVHQGTGCCVYETRIYLTLPEEDVIATHTHRFRGRRTDSTTVCGRKCANYEEPPCRLGEENCLTVESFAHELTIPREPNEEEKGRFVHMLKTIGMPGWGFGGSVDSESNIEELCERARPKLTMLTHVDIRRDRRKHEEDPSVM
ncbi:hypothetical protein LTR56_013162 [Elasticomyces elasticus]|nr:hypothetical protein LTR56_013162 [Elasticomyces elasticus]KAK3656662.1 hypothetical protein LTR22_009641 [Elasticomyces elasticus]KAK4921534.1 hypothetical protein LTR49_011004 [Elasticomyces elasticus]KAK5760222.1 hypothetical protein LTS12_009606 [Elasticomyces elasticus]